MKIRERESLYEFKRMLLSEQLSVPDVLAKPRDEWTTRETLFMVYHLKFRIHFFLHYDEASLRRLFNVMSLVVFDENEIVFRQNSPSDSMYIILQGEVGVYFD